MISSFHLYFLILLLESQYSTVQPGQRDQSQLEYHSFNRRGRKLVKFIYKQNTRNKLASLFTTLIGRNSYKGIYIMIYIVKSFVVMDSGYHYPIFSYESLLLSILNHFLWDYTNQDSYRKSTTTSVQFLYKSFIICFIMLNINQIFQSQTHPPF